MRIFIFSLLLFIALPAAAQDFSAPIQTKASPVLVELFSSENCPACPPADKYMQTLMQSKGVIALSCHVDYFGRTSANLGKKFCTERQGRYIDQIGRKSYFTPQMMINGHMSEIGYEFEQVSAAIVKGRSERVSEISIRPKSDGVYDFSIPERQYDGQADIWMAVYEKPKTVLDHGGRMTFYNVVSRFIPLGNWGGGQIGRAIYPITDDKSAGFAIVAQDRKSGEVVAAGDYKF